MQSCGETYQLKFHLDRKISLASTCPMFLTGIDLSLKLAQVRDKAPFFDLDYPTF